jgi:hypothetical protein
MITPTCFRCGKPIVPGEARYTAGEPEKYQHYDCFSRWLDETKTILAGRPGAVAIIDWLRGRRR